MGLSLDDFMQLTPEEYRHVVSAWQQHEEQWHHDNWERMRLQATINVQPWIKKRLTPRELLPLPWDQTPAEAGKATVDKAEALARFKRLAARHGNDNDNDNENDEKL